MTDLKRSKKRTSEFTREVLFRVKFIGIQQGVLKFGVAIKMEDSNEYNYYCPDKKVWEETGYFRSIPETV